MISLGRHSYSRGPHERFDPVVNVGAFTSIAENVTFYGSGCEHPTVMTKQAVSNYPFKELDWGEYPPCQGRGDINIGNDVWIGEHVIILDGTTIGDGAIIGAGSVVSGEIPPFAVAVGNPCTVKKFRFNHEQIVKILNNPWWNWSDEEIKNKLDILSDIGKLMEVL